MVRPICSIASLLLGILLVVGLTTTAATAERSISDDVSEIAEDSPTEAELVAYQPSAQPQPAAEARRPATRRSTRSAQPSNLRLASVPKMFGDVQFNGAQAALLFVGRDNGQPPLQVVDLPLAGGARRLKIGENNSPLPEDRVLFLYNHFHNAIDITEQEPGDPPVMRSTHVDRYTFGIEKTYWDEMASLEVRMPLVSSFDFATFNDEIVIDGGNVGNLSLISKYLLYAEDSWALSAGLAIDLPTGSNTTIRTSDTFLTIENEAVHLLPYLGVVIAPNDLWFTQSFAQLDFATDGNPVTGTSLPDTLRYNDQNLLYLDTMVGRWLLRDPDAPVLTGIAVVSELHYTTTIQDTDVVPFVQRSPATSDAFLAGVLANQFNRIDVINLTTAMQVELGQTALRVGVVVPLEDGDDERFFDSEVQVQVNRRY